MHIESSFAATRASFHMRRLNCRLHIIFAVSSHQHRALLRKYKIRFHTAVKDPPPPPLTGPGAYTPLISWVAPTVIKDFGTEEARPLSLQVFNLFSPQFIFSCGSCDTVVLDIGIEVVWSLILFLLFCTYT